MSKVEKWANIHQGLLQAGKNEIRMQLDNYSLACILSLFQTELKTIFKPHKRINYLLFSEKKKKYFSLHAGRETIQNKSL